MKTIKAHRVTYVLILLCCLGGPLVAQQFSSFYPPTITRGQPTTFIISGTSSQFNSISGFGLGTMGQFSYFQNPTWGGSPMQIFPTYAETVITLPSSTTMPQVDLFWYMWGFDGGVGTVTVINPGVNTGNIRGAITRDTTLNCVPGDTVSGRIVEFLPGPYYTTTDQYGMYNMWLPVGTYTASVLNLGPLETQFCPTVSSTVTLSSPGQTINNYDFKLLQQNVVDLVATPHVNAHRPGFNTTNYVTVKNQGAQTATNVVVKVAIDTAVSYLGSSPTGTWVPDTLTYNIGSVPGNSQQLLYFQINTPVNTPLNDTIGYYAEVTSSQTDAIPGNNTGETFLLVSGSYDPNDKQVWNEANVDADGDIAPTDSILRYLIRFQNTGTDTAFNIYIRDTFDLDLDPGTINVISSSHNYGINVFDGNKFDFVFQNILLPDSNINEPASHGHIEYTIKLKPNRPLGTMIDNTAHIYFDFNAPIVTNTVNSRICEPVNLDFSFVQNQGMVSLTNNSSGTSGTYMWDFGDGNTSTAASPTHSYASPGSYSLCLIYNDSCGARSYCQNVSVICQVPIANYTSQFNSLVVNFNDQSSASAFSWSWDFGDGNISSQQNPQHTYALPGTYQVCLTITDSCSANTFCDSVNVTCAAPTPGFNWASNQLAVTFNDQSTGQFTPVYQWDFGDGSNSTQQSPQHTYALPGTYQVCLTVSDACGTNTFCDSVTVTCPAPSAAYTYNAVGLQVGFSDMTPASGNPVGWSWNFGDGNSSTQQNPTHTYTNAGNYTACMTVTNDCGSTDSTCQAILIIGQAGPQKAEVTLYPNPNDGLFNLEMQFVGIAAVNARVFDLAGRKLYEADWGPNAGQLQKRIDLAHLPAGSYLMEVMVAGQRVVKMLHIR